MIGEVLTDKIIRLQVELAKVENKINRLKFNLNSNHYLIAKLEFDADNLRDSLKVAGVR